MTPQNGWQWLCMLVLKYYELIHQSNFDCVQQVARRATMCMPEIWITEWERVRPQHGEPLFDIFENQFVYLAQGHKCHSPEPTLLTTTEILSIQCVKCTRPFGHNYSQSTMWNEQCKSNNFWTVIMFVYTNVSVRQSIV